MAIQERKSVWRRRSEGDNRESCKQIDCLQNWYEEAKALEKPSNERKQKRENEDNERNWNNKAYKIYNVDAYLVWQLDVKQ